MPRVTNFDLSHQEIINMWPWDEFENNLSSIFQSIFQYLLSSLLILSTNLSDLFLFIFLKVFVQHFLFQEKFFVQKLVLFIFFILFSLCQKNRRTNRLNSFVSLFSLTKDSKDWIIILYYGLSCDYWYFSLSLFQDNWCFKNLKPNSYFFFNCTLI